MGQFPAMKAKRLLAVLERCLTHPQTLVSKPHIFDIAGLLPLFAQSRSGIDLAVRQAVPTAMVP
jgi:hypothetical protein